MTVPKALTIAGSDSGGGAGIQADLKTFSAFRVFGTSVLTAITAQNSVGVHGVHELPPAFVRALIGAVAEGLAAHPHGPVVLDPVMIAKSGDPLLRPDARQALASLMLPIALVVTPNLHEAATLAGMPVTTEKEMEEAARRILTLGARTVLVKGGHLKDSATDILWDGTRFTRFPGPRIESTATHGTGCTFSSAIAAGLALGRDLADAIREAKAYVTAAIRGGFQAGHGVGALRHFVERW